MIVDPNGTQGQVKLNPASYESNYTTKNGGNVYNAQIDVIAHPPAAALSGQ